MSEGHTEPRMPTNNIWQHESWRKEELNVWKKEMNTTKNGTKHESILECTFRDLNLGLLDRVAVDPLELCSQVGLTSLRIRHEVQRHPTRQVLYRLACTAGLPRASGPLPGFAMASRRPRSRLRCFLNVT